MTATLVRLAGRFLAQRTGRDGHQTHAPNPKTTLNTASARTCHDSGGCRFPSSPVPGGVTGTKCHAQRWKTQFGARPRPPTGLLSCQRLPCSAQGASIAAPRKGGSSKDGDNRQDTEGREAPPEERGERERREGGEVRKKRE